MTIKPTKSVEALADYFSRLRKRPEEAPEDNYAAARWFIELMEPAKEYEAPREMSRKNGEGTYWVTPYTDRLIYCLRRYLSMNEIERTFIRGASEDKVYWRGDEINAFRIIYDETMRMREIEIEKYRRDAIKKMRSTIRGMTR